MRQPRRASHRHDHHHGEVTAAPAPRPVFGTGIDRSDLVDRPEGVIREIRLHPSLMRMGLVSRLLLATVAASFLWLIALAVRS